MLLKYSVPWKEYLEELSQFLASIKKIKNNKSRSSGLLCRGELF